jgi:flagellar motor switch protein FliN/FliY
MAMPTTQYAPPPQQGYAPPPPGYQPHYAPPPPPQVAPGVSFQNFDVASVMQQKENIEIIMDVPLEVTVELGRTTRKIKDILEFSPGSIIELNKLAGEPIDILVNGKFVAKGEVVVIDENFGIRITDIVNAEHRI